MTVFIYGLYCPLTGDLRYIGKANDPQARLRKHLAHAKWPENYNQRWIASLVRNGEMPRVEVLYEVGASECWRSIERQFIAEALGCGARLTNTSAGGEGVELLDPVIEARRRARILETWSDDALRKEHAARIRIATSSDEYRKSRADQSAKLWEDPSYRGLVSQRVGDAYASAEARQAQSERSRKAHLCPEVEARRAKSLSDAWNREGARDRRKAAMREAQQRDDVRVKNAAAMRDRYRNNPEFRAKVKEVMSDPEMIARRNIAIKAGWARRLAAKRAAEGDEG